MSLSPTATAPADASDPSRMWEAQARSLFDVGRYAEALPLLLKALSSRPDDAMLCCRIAYAHSHLKNHAETQRWAERALTSDPENEWAHRQRAHAFWSRKRLKEAMRAVQDAVHCAPEEPACHRLLTNLHLARNCPKKARESAERMRELAPHLADTHGTLAAVALAEGHRFRNSRRGRESFREAEAHARQGLAIAPDSPALMNQLAIALTRQGRATEATPLLHASARLNPTNTTTQKLLTQNVFAQFLGGAAALLGICGIAVTLLVFRLGLPLWPALIAGPVACALVAEPLFRRFSEGWMARQKRFRALADPMQATLRLLARDRKGALMGAFVSTSLLVGGIPAIVLGLLALREPKDYADIVVALNRLFHPGS